MTDDSRRSDLNWIVRYIHVISSPEEDHVWGNTLATTINNLFRRGFWGQDAQEVMFVVKVSLATTDLRGELSSLLFVLQQNTE